MATDHSQDVLGGCYCGEVRFRIPGQAQPLQTGYCHCVACRQAHAAPVYAVAWLPDTDFEITQGQEFLKWYTRSDTLRAYLRRHFCTNCGSKVFNSYNGPFGDQQISALGAFPTLFDDQVLARSEPWAPSMHMHCAESLMDVSLINDGLPKLPKGGDGG
jgi:hypothetical protein